MKKLLGFILALSLFGSATSSNAQAYLKPGKNSPIEIWSQMWNTSNTYYGTILPAAAPTNLGAQYDTVVNTGTVVLQMAKFAKGAVAVDTFTPYPLNGTGNIVVFAEVGKSTGTPSVVCTLLSGVSSLNMAPVPGATVYTVTPTTTQNVCWNIPKNARHYAVSFTGSATSTASLRSWFYFQQSNFISWGGN